MIRFHAKRVCLILLAMFVFLSAAFWGGVWSQPLVEKVIVKLTPSEPAQTLPEQYPVPQAFPKGSLVLDPINARSRLNTFKELAESGIRIDQYAGVTEWLRFEDEKPRNLTVVARGRSSPHGYPIMQVLLESPEGGTLFDKRIKVFADDWEGYEVKLPALQGEVMLRIIFLRGVFEGRGDTLDIQSIAVSDSQLLQDPLPEPSLKQLTDPMIRQHRMGTLRVLAEPGDTVSIVQTRHAFQFGSSLSNSLFNEGALDAGDLKRYKETFLKYFNSATPAVLYWHMTERRRNRPDFASADRTIQWCKDSGLYVRGHTVFWGSDIRGRIMDWQKRLKDEDLQNVIRRRGKEVAARYRGIIDEYDFNNEMVHHRYFRTRMYGIPYDMAMSMKAGDPDAVLYYNDFNVLTLGALDDYTDLLDRLLANQVPIEGLGVQGHSDGEIYYKHAWEALDRLESYDMPIKITEAGPAVWDEQARAVALEKLFRTCFAHPAVDGITIWGFWQPMMWQKNAALWDKDWNLLPAGEVFVRLLRDEWWTTWSGQADGNGMVELPAYYGEYDVTVNDREPVHVTLSKDAGELTVEAP